MRRLSIVLSSGLCLGLLASIVSVGADATSQNAFNGKSGSYTNPLRCHQFISTVAQSFSQTVPLDIRNNPDRLNQQSNKLNNLSTLTSVGNTVSVLRSQGANATQLTINDRLSNEGTGDTYAIVDKDATGVKGVYIYSPSGAYHYGFARATKYGGQSPGLAPSSEGNYNIQASVQDGNGATVAPRQFTVTSAGKISNWGPVGQVNPDFVPKGMSASASVQAESDTPEAKTLLTSAVSQEAVGLNEVLQALIHPTGSDAPLEIERAKQVVNQLTKSDLGDAQGLGEVNRPKTIDQWVSSCRGANLTDAASSAITSISTALSQMQKGVQGNAGSTGQGTNVHQAN